MNHNTYNTKQRDEIVDFFSRHRGDCYTARDLIKSGEITVGEATVYRTLSKLASQGVLTRFTGDGNGASYQLNESEECKTHFHLRCEVCQRLIHMDCSFMQDIRAHIEDSHSFTVDVGKTVFYGICGECREKMGGTK